MKRRMWAVVLAFAVTVAVTASAYGFGGGPFGGGGSSDGFRGSQSPPQKATPVATGDLEMLYQEALHKAEGEGDLPGAIKLFKQVVKRHERSRSLAAKSLLHIARAHETMGNTDEAEKVYRRLSADFASTPEGALAVKLVGDKEKRQGPPEDPRTVEVRRKLEKVLPSFNFPDSRLSRIISVLRQLGDINIVMSMSPGAHDQPITLELTKPVTIAEVLDWTTKKISLAWTVHQSSVFVGTTQEVAALEGQGRTAELHAEQLKLIDEKAERARLALEWAKMLSRKGMASVGELAEARKEYINARQERLDFLYGSEAARAKPAVTLPTTSTSIIPTPVEATTPTTTTSRVEVYEEPPGKKVTLYNALLENFTGPQLLDINTGEMIPVAGDLGRAFNENPDFDLAFAAGKVSVGRSGYSVIYKATVVLSRSCRAAYLPADTTVDNPPRAVAYAELVAGRERDVYSGTGGMLTVNYDRVLALKDLPFIIETREGSFLVRVRRLGGDRLSLWYEPLPQLGLREGRDVEIQRLDLTLADRRKRYEGTLSNPNVDRMWLLSMQIPLLEVRVQRARTLALLEKSPDVKKRLEGKAAQLEEVLKRSREYQEQFEIAGRWNGSVRLFDSTYAGPHVFDIDSGRTAQVPKGKDVRDFLSENRQYDLAFLASNRNVLLANGDIHAALLPNNFDIKRLPAEIEYTEPKRIEGQRAVDDDGKLPMMEDGVYREGSGHVVLAGRAFVIRTDGGEYSLYINYTGGPAAMNFNYQMVPPRGPLPEMPPYDEDTMTMNNRPTGRK